MNCAFPFDSVAVSGAPLSTTSDTTPVGIPVAALTVTVTTALLLYVTVGALIDVVVGVLPGRGPEANVAVTLVAAVRFTEQEPVPPQPPLQPVKVDPVVGVAASATVVSLG